ncbi:AraC family transcriptional regulator ligand-binding domain-containing protein [Kitasatospora sp. NPDC051853]|uniref:AraC family transcriptional regulator n=1 Tax=Kitasatospora sp. NPDC051853 TaxID=3364058 RepID=UPI0037B0817A
MALYRHEGTTPAAFTRVNARSATALGVAPEQYRHLLGMAPEHLTGDRFRTPAATNIRLWQLMVTQAPWTQVSLLMTEQSGLGDFGVWDYLLTSAPTPLDGLRDAAEYMAALGDAGTEEFRITEEDGLVVVSHANEADLTDDTAAAIRGYSLGLLRRRLSESLRRDVRPVRAALAARAPRDHRALVELYGTRAVEFEAPITSVAFAAAELRAANPHAQPGISTVLRAHAGQYLASAVPLHSWLDQFRDALRAALRATEGRGRPSLAEVARRMATSPRTLQRRLDEHGTTWRAELETCQGAQVLDLLRRTDLGLDAIAARSGYTDARALRRAVRRWSGRAPSTLRGGPGAAAGREAQETGEDGA